MNWETADVLVNSPDLSATNPGKPLPSWTMQKDPTPLPVQPWHCPSVTSWEMGNSKHTLKKQLDLIQTTEFLTKGRLKACAKDMQLQRKTEETAGSAQI